MARHAGAEHPWAKDAEVAYRAPTNGSWKRNNLYWKPFSSEYLTWEELSPNVYKTEDNQDKPEGALRSSAPSASCRASG